MIIKIIPSKLSQIKLLMNIFLAFYKTNTHIIISKKNQIVKIMKYRMIIIYNNNHEMKNQVL